MAEIAGVELPAAVRTEDRLSALFITDDRDLTELYQLKLTIDGYDLRVAGRDEPGLGQGTVPDLLFYDLEDGSDAAIQTWRRLRETPAFMDIPAILLSALPAATLLERGLRLGSLDHLLPVARANSMASLIDLDAMTRIPGESTPR